MWLLKIRVWSSRSEDIYLNPNSGFLVMLSKKEKERKSVSPIIDYLNLPEENLDWSSEKPDCRFTNLDGETIGIEVVRCQNEKDDIIEMTALLTGACKECEIRLKALGVSNRFISVSFNSKIQRHKPNIKKHKLFQAIFDEICHLLREDDYYNHQYVDSINVFNNHEGLLEVDPVLLFFVPDITPDAVKECIDKKNEKLKQYLSLHENNNIIEYWLFIAIEWDSFTSLGALPAINIQTDFKHIYICDHETVKTIV